MSLGHMPIARWITSVAEHLLYSCSSGIPTVTMVTPHRPSNHLSLPQMDHNSDMQVHGKGGHHMQLWHANRSLACLQVWARYGKKISTSPSCQVNVQHQGRSLPSNLPNTNFMEGYLPQNKIMHKFTQKT